MTSVYEIKANELIEKLAEQLKDIKEIKPPIWAQFVKTGHFKERPPIKKDWWYTRTAAILRVIYIRGPIGTSKLSTKYGGKKNRGVRPGHFYRGSRNIIRKILQQGEKAGLLIQTKKGVHKGRILTPKGKSIIDKLVVELKKQNSPKVKPTVEKVVKEEKKKEQPKSEVKKDIKKVKKPKEQPKQKETKKPEEKKKEQPKPKKK